MKLSPTMIDCLKYLAGFRGPGSTWTVATEAALIKRDLIQADLSGNVKFVPSPAGWAFVAQFGLVPPPAPEPTPATPLVVSDDLADSSPAVKLLSLSTPQRKALGNHLYAYALEQARVMSPEDLVITTAQAVALARRLESPAVSAVTPQDMAVLESAVYLSPARDLISTATLRTLERAWTRLGWTWIWPGPYSGLDQAVSAAYNQAVDLAQRGEEKIRAILNPPPGPVLDHPLNTPIHPDVTKAAEAQLAKVRAARGTVGPQGFDCDLCDTFTPMWGSCQNTACEGYGAEPQDVAPMAWHPFMRDCGCSECTDHYKAMADLNTRIGARTCPRCQRVVQGDRGQVLHDKVCTPDRPALVISKEQVLAKVGSWEDQGGFLIIDDPMGTPANPEQREKMRVWFETTMAKRVRPILDQVAAAFDRYEGIIPTPENPGPNQEDILARLRDQTKGQPFGMCGPFTVWKVDGDLATVLEECIPLDKRPTLVPDGASPDNPDLDFGGVVRGPGAWGGPEDPAD